MSKKLIAAPDAMPAPLASQVNKLVLLAEPSESYLPPEVAFDPAAPAFLEKRRAAAAPGHRDQCRAWLLMLASAYNGVGEDAVTMRMATVWATCSILPATVWCEATLGEVIRRHPRFFPQAGEIFEILQGHAKPLQDEIAALERIAKAPRATPVFGVEASKPYIREDIPAWVGKGRIADSADIPPHPPVRTPEQQIAALKGEA